MDAFLLVQVHFTMRHINTLKKQEKLLTKFDGLVWGSLLESATIKDKDVIVFRFKDGTEING